MSDVPAVPEKKSFSERFRSKPENAAKAAEAAAAHRSKARIDRSEYYYVKLHRIQTARLRKLGPVAFELFVLLLEASFEHRGRPFELPVAELAALPGFSRATLYRVLLKLQRDGLVSIARRPPNRLPLIHVPLSL
jgi:CRP-like cAMP-binding protein